MVWTTCGKVMISGRTVREIRQGFSIESEMSQQKRQTKKCHDLETSFFGDIKLIFKNILSNKKMSTFLRERNEEKNNKSCVNKELYYNIK
ncbi:hypothetical protein BpHYR1_005762 [Brachionus plicatilis]|uniref:Uncharacterized protein n=1 Tax=Brachionus plicatilis TaxID=10195 RepID=A0A3M7R7D3_BRAPC|nr:hypothetical protein BpHYR1_005762 [Brachionus plicatilis]